MDAAERARVLITLMGRRLCHGDVDGALGLDLGLNPNGLHPLFLLILSSNLMYSRDDTKPPEFDVPASHMEEIGGDSELRPAFSEAPVQTLRVALKAGDLGVCEVAFGVEAQLSVHMEDIVAEEHIEILGVALCAMGVGVEDVVKDGYVFGL